jgi:hypothetical protein
MCPLHIWLYNLRPISFDAPSEYLLGALAIKIGLDLGTSAEIRSASGNSGLFSNIVGAKP